MNDAWTRVHSERLQVRNKGEREEYARWRRGPAARRAPPAHVGDVAGSTIATVNMATKLLAAMRRNPLDWQIEQFQTVARQHGIEWRHDDGSHCVFITNDGKTLPVPARRPIKPIYVKKFLDLLDGA